CDNRMQPATIPMDQAADALMTSTGACTDLPKQDGEWPRTGGGDTFRAGEALPCDEHLPREAAATAMSSDAASAVDPRVREAELNHGLLLDRQGRQFVPVAGSRWGELILPAPGEAEGAGTGGLRVVMFASYEFGYLALEAVKAYARRFPGRLQLVELTTDDPMNAEARIGLKKRIWKHVSREEVVAIETAVVEAARGSAGLHRRDQDRRLSRGPRLMAARCHRELRVRTGDRCHDHRTPALRHLQFPSHRSRARLWRRAYAGGGLGGRRHDEHGMDHPPRDRSGRCGRRRGGFAPHQHPPPAPPAAPPPPPP